MAAGILALTGYFTGTEYRPVKDVGKTSLTGAATVILSGLVGRLRVRGLHRARHRRRRLRRLPARWRTLTVSLFAVALAGCGLLTTVGVIVAMDTFGPVSDNAQGIAEMSGDVSAEGAQILTELDAVGNTTKAITKGIAIATAVLAATALFGSYTDVGLRGADARPTPQRGRARPAATSRCSTQPCIVGVLLGAAVVFLFSGPGDQRRRPGRGRGRVRGASPVPRDPRDHGGHRPSGVRQGRRHRHQGLAARAGHAGHPGGAGPDRGRLRPRRRPRWPASSPARSAPAP